MRAALILSVACLASAAEDGASQSLRGSRSLSDAVENLTQPQETSSHLAASGVDDGELLAAAWAGSTPNASTPFEGNISEDALGPLALLQAGRGGWSQGGDKMWGSGRGVENVNSGNVGYYDSGMAAAHARCGGSSCVLMVNPAGHRTVEVFHVHFAHYAGYGASLKQRLESKVCGAGGWHGGGLPCHGKAAFFPGFPGVFSKAMTGGGIQHASVIAWPGSCGGRGTIVQLAYGCSIEHQIRGDYNPNYR